MAVPSFLARGTSSSSLGLCSSCRAAREGLTSQQRSREPRYVHGGESAHTLDRGRALESLNAIKTLGRALARVSLPAGTSLRTSTRRGANASLSSNLHVDGFSDVRYPHSWGRREIKWDRKFRWNDSLTSSRSFWIRSLSHTFVTETASVDSQDFQENHQGNYESDGKEDGTPRSDDDAFWQEGGSDSVAYSVGDRAAAVSDRERDVHMSRGRAIEDGDWMENLPVFNLRASFEEVLNLRGFDILDIEGSFDVLKWKAKELILLIQGVLGLVDHIGERIGKGEVKLHVQAHGLRPTPLRLVKIVACVIAACLVVTSTAKVASSLILNSNVLLHVGQLLVRWPPIVAGALGAFAVYKTVTERSRSQPTSSAMQFTMLLAALTWLIPAPFGLINGYIDPWPLFMGVVYLIFFYMGSVRRVLGHGGLAKRSDDQQWQSTGGRVALVGFVAAVVAGHWLAAWEASHAVVRIPFVKVLSSVMAIAAFRLHIRASRVLDGAFDRVVVPQQLVTYGPYSSIRHPIYTSYMLLFTSYCLGLNSFFSLAFLVTVSGLYYWKRTGLEEKLLESAFGEAFLRYKRETPHRFIHWLL